MLARPEFTARRLEILKWLAEQGRAVKCQEIRQRFALPWNGPKGDEFNRLVRHWWFTIKSGAVGVSEKGVNHLQGREDPPWRHPWHLKPEAERAEVRRKAMIRRKKREGAIRSPYKTAMKSG